MFGSVSEGRHPGMWERNKIKSGAKASTVFSRSHHDRRWALCRLWIVQNTQNHAKFLRLPFQPLHGGFFSLTNSVLKSKAVNFVGFEKHDGGKVCFGVKFGKEKYFTEKEVSKFLIIISRELQAYPYNLF